MIKTRALFVCSLILVQIFIISPVDTVRPTTHAPIYIDGNANFASKALAEGWRGDGSIGKPYIIENYDINASTAHGIDIRNTNVYFIIRNCKIQGGKTNWDGIHFYNVANVEIQNVSSYDNRIGIRLDTVVNGNFQHVSSYNNSMGFYLSSSSSNKITSSQIYKNSDAIYIRYYSSNNKITSSQIYNNYNGISLGYSSNNEIHYNNIYNNTNYGVYNLNTEAQYTANATYNWLGSPDGPGDKGPGTGDNVSSNVIYDPWMKELLELLPPTVIQTSPYNGEIDVPLDKKILITFSEPMNISTIPGNITIEPGLEIKDYLWSKNNTTLTLLLSINLTSYTKYTVIINTNITDSSDAIDSNGVMHFIKNHLPEPYLFSFRTKDITPPIINIVSPSNCTITNQSVELIYTISDNADLLENLTIKGPANGTVYSDDGDYTITINVKDRANNTAEKIVKFIIDKTAPNITVLGVVDGGYYNISVIPIISVNDKNLNTSSITLNNLPFESGTSITEEGNYILAIRGVDKANNKAEKKVKFTIDKTAPNINITGAVDGYCNTSVTPIINITDMNLNTSSIKLNSIDFFSGTEITEDGNYILIVEAVDKAGNKAEKKLSFTIDKTAPSINITGVVDGFFYGINVTPEIMINDTNLNATSISIELNGKSFVSGTTISEEGKYALVIKAKDKAGNEKLLSIYFAIDKQLPLLKINGLPELTNQAEIKIEGKTEEGADVWVNEKKIKVENRNFSTLITLNEGENIIIIEARDPAGNIIKKIEKIIVLDTIPPSLEIITPKKYDTEKKEIEVKGKTEAGAKVYINDFEVDVSDEGEFSYKAGLVEGKNIIIIRAVDIAGNEKIEKLVINRREPVSQLFLPIVALIIVVCFLSSILIYFIRKKKTQPIIPQTPTPPLVEEVVPSPMPTKPEEVKPEIEKKEEDLAIVSAELVQKARDEVKELEKEIGTYLFDETQSWETFTKAWELEKAMGKYLLDAENSLEKMDYPSAKKNAEEALSIVEKIKESRRKP